MPFGSSRYPSSGAVSSLASAPRRDSITHTCKPLTRSLNRHHVCTHKASHYGGARGGCGGADFGGRRASGSARQRRQLHGFGGIGSGGGGGIGSGGRIVGGRGFLLLRRKSAAVTLRRRLRCRRLQPLQRCAAVRILTASNAPALRMPLLCHGHSRCRRWNIRLRGANTCANCREEAGENLQEQEVEHVGQRQAFRNREKGRAARVVFERRLRLLHARSHCSAMNMVMLQIGCKSACVKINACCCACWRA